MKSNPFHNVCLAVLAGFALVLSGTAIAGGNTGQMIARFEPIKSAEAIAQLKESDSIVKVCRACNVVTLVRIEKSGKGRYDVTARKCADCGSTDTYFAASRQNIPFKEQIKR